jgi:hypothetical protein
MRTKCDAKNTTESLLGVPTKTTIRANFIKYLSSIGLVNPRGNFVR